MSEKLTKVEFTHLDKILYPEKKIAKSEVIEYYIKIAPKMLKLLSDRPLVLTRFPNGSARATTINSRKGLMRVCTIVLRCLK